MDFSIAGCGFKAEIDYLTFGLRRCRPGHFDSAECAKKKPKQKKRKSLWGKGLIYYSQFSLLPDFIYFLMSRQLFANFGGSIKWPKKQGASKENIRSPADA